MDVGEVLVFVGLGVAALLGRHIALYLAACTGLLMWGLVIADSDIMTGIPIIMAAGYFLWRSYEVWFGR